MNTAEQILVIFLSTALAIFLILGIILLTKLIEVVNRIKVITEKAEDLADKAEAVGTFLGKTAKPAILIKALSNIARTYKSKDKSGKE